MVREKLRYLMQVQIQALRRDAAGRADAARYRGNITAVQRWLVIDIALQSGLRRQEIANIQLKHLHLSQNIIAVQTLKRRKPKVDHLKVPDSLVKHIKQYLEYAEPKKFLFEGQRGPLTGQGIGQIFKRAAKLAGLPADLSIHSCRHTVGFHLLARTKNLRQVQKQLRHQNPASTAVYADVDSQQMQAGMTDLYG